MAEFLVYNKEHWMDKLSQAEVDARKFNNISFQTKYDSRYQKGDVVEVREDSYWTGGRGFNKQVFALVVVPNLSLEKAKKYMEAEVTNSDPLTQHNVIIRRRKYRVDLNNIILDVKKEGSLTGENDTNLIDKTK